MTVEEGAKLVISAGLVTPKGDKAKTKHPGAVPEIDAGTAAELPRVAESERV
jgi:uncharacterized membrane protein